MITEYMCVKCNVLQKDVDHEIITGKDTSFFLCEGCYGEWIKSRTKDLNNSEVIV